MKMIALGLFMVLVPHLTFAALPKLASKVLTQASTQPIPQFSLDILEQKIQSLKGKSKKKKSSFFKAHQAFLQSDWKGLSTEASHWIAQGHYIVLAEVQGTERVSKKGPRAEELLFKLKALS